MTLPALTSPPPPPPPVRLPQPLAEVPAASASAFVLELLWAAVRDRVDPAHVAAALTAVPPTLASAASRLADAVWLVWLELDHASSGGEEDATSEDLRRKLVALTRALLAPPGVAAPTPSAPLTRALLLERCEGDFLESCGCVASAARFKKREVRFNTKRVYVQRKFNLLREESEGYAKLIAALAAIREGPEPPPPPEENNDDSAAEYADGKDAADERVSRVALRDSARAETLELIGAFDLDPNRALALILEALELAPTHRGLRDLLERFDREHVGQVLGFAFQRAAELSRADAAASSSRGGGGVRTSFVREPEPGTPPTIAGPPRGAEEEEEEEEGGGARRVVARSQRPRRPARRGVVRDPRIARARGVLRDGVDASALLPPTTSRAGGRRHGGEARGGAARRRRESRRRRFGRVGQRNHRPGVDRGHTRGRVLGRAEVGVSARGARGRGRGDGRERPRAARRARRGPRGGPEGEGRAARVGEEGARGAVRSAREPARVPSGDEETRRRKEGGRRSADGRRSGAADG